MDAPLDHLALAKGEQAHATVTVKMPIINLIPRHKVCHLIPPYPF
jgi:hypothetical protein